MSVVWSVVLVIVITYSILALTLYFMQPKFVYSPVREVTYTPADMDLDYEKAVFKTADNLSLEGWYIPAPNARFTVLFCHGKGGNMTHRLDTISFFYELGLNCFIFDYRGYGNSQGRPSEEGTYLDAAAAYKWLSQRKNIKPENVVLFGRSLGGSIAAQLASKISARGLVLESSFTSYVDVGRKFYPYMPVRWFATFSYKTVDYLSKIKCPVMIVHSRNDEVVPFELGLRLYDAANEPKEFIEIFGTHNDGFLHSGDIYRQGWTNWLGFMENYKPLTKPTLKQIS